MSQCSEIARDIYETSCHYGVFGKWSVFFDDIVEDYQILMSDRTKEEILSELKKIPGVTEAEYDEDSFNLTVDTGEEDSKIEG